jgi:TolA-binding protein
MERAQQAMYAYKKYLDYYPDSKYASIAKERLQKIKSGDFGGGGSVPDFSQPASPAAGISDEDMTDFSIEEDSTPPPAQETGGSRSPLAGERSPLAGEMDDFLSESKSGDMLDDFTFDEPVSAPANNVSQDINETFYEGMRLFAAGQYQEAVALYDRIINSKSLQGESERKTFEKAHFELGRCQYKLGKFNEALGTLSGLIKKFPNSSMVKSALLYIGMIFEDTKNFDKAVTYYNKVMSMEPKDQTNKDAQNRLTKIQNSQGRR